MKKSFWRLREMTKKTQNPLWTSLRHDNAVSFLLHSFEWNNLCHKCDNIEKSSHHRNIFTIRDFPLNNFFEIQTNVARVKILLRFIYLN